ncbi:hypothetical protein FYK55_25165 [Roseiconus nitratireducens]|uniref:Uncharacterized protein n=1 Tax=Roseiconus nitratireducens TaxID=2605748 RepID=A0A5M6CVX1_9BACT|nr:hypothetical protein [Roseiconus nitratireducens]KAA5539213.1 hypothetical protein FYK55_25165 [Roseiconus nitratireducens]
MSDRSSTPRASGRRAGWLRRLGIAFVVLALLVIIAPAVIARTGLRDRLINTIMAAPSLTASTGAASLGWISPVSIDDLKIEGKQHRFRIEVDSVTTDRPWPQLFASSPDLGTISVEKPRLWCKLPLGEKGTVSPLLSPIFTAAIHDASMSVESDLSDQPLIDFDGVDLTAHVRDSDQGRWLSVEPFEIYQREVLTPEHCDQLLGLISPSLGDAAEVEGEFSLSMSNLRLPIGLSEREAMEQLEAQGELALHRVAIQTGNPMLKMLAKLVADIHQTQPPSQTRVVKDALIKFQARDGRLYHEGLRFGFPDIDPGLEVLARGSVGLDQSLDTVLEIPRLDPAKQQQKGPVRCQVTGTVGNPQFSVQDASLVVRLPNRAEPLIDVDGVDFTAHVEDSPSGRVISFDPMELLDRDKIDRNLASTLLQFVDPGLGYSPKVDGEVSLSLDQLRLPIGAVDDD